MKTLVLTILLLNLFIGFSQIKYNPRILILTPTTFEYDSCFKDDIIEIESHLKKVNFLGDGEDINKHSENIQTTIKSFQNFTNISKVSGFLPLLISEKMLFSMFRGKRDFIVLIDTLTADGNANELKQIADKYDVQHVVYFPEVSIFKKDTIGYCSMTMNIYDRNTNSCSFQQKNTEDWIVDESDFPEFSDQRTAHALLYNVSYFSGFKILETIRATNPLILQQINERRKEDEAEMMYDDWEEIEENEKKEDILNLLIKQYFKKVYDTNTLSNFFSDNGQSFSTKGIYQILYNHDSTKFVAFVMDTTQSSSHLNLIPKYKWVERDCIKYNIVTKKSYSNENYVGSLIRGTKEEGKGWFFDKWECGEFNSRTLEEAQKMFFCNLYYWHFIDYWDLNTNDEFWSSDESEDNYLFHYIEKPDNYKPYKYEGLKAWDKFFPENISFQHKTVVEANHIVREMNSFESRFIKENLEPFYIKCFQNKINIEPNPILIYTSQRDIVIHPLIIENETGDKNLKYYVYLDQTKSFYEWTFIKEKDLLADSLLLDIVKNKFNQITVFSLENFLIFRDQHFWDNYVLSESKGKYNYLELIK